MQDVDSKWAEDLEKVPLFARSAETDLKKQWFAETYLSLLKDFIAKQEEAGEDSWDFVPEILPPRAS